MCVQADAQASGNEDADLDAETESGALSLIDFRQAAKPTAPGMEDSSLSNRK